jgi:hypothetical protein
VIRCICCNDTSHKRSDCGPYTNSLKEGIVIFKEGRIRDAAIVGLLETNFGRSGLKKLMEEKLGKTNFIHARGAKTYHIEVGQSTVEASINTSREVMIRGSQAIKRLTRWDDPKVVTTIKTYLVGDHGVDISTKTSVEFKRDRATEDKEVEEPASKKKPPNGRGVVLRERPTNCIYQREET